MSEALQPPPPTEAGPSPAAPAIEPAPTVEVAAPPPAPRGRPSFIFFGVLAVISLALDVGSKAWAEIVLLNRSPFEPPLVVLDGHLAFTLAYNRGGAWGLLQNASEAIRRPFFLGVSAIAILFIVSLYGRLHPKQWALKWGLPLVLGGALGNLADRIMRGSVVDFIDYSAAWVETMNTWIAKLYPSWGITQHWPTFNVADISICIGVGLMAVDMLTAHRLPSFGQAEEAPREQSPQGASSQPNDSSGRPGEAAQSG